MTQLEEGDKIFHVYAFPNKGAYITEYTFVAYATMQGINVPSIITKERGEISQRDCNIIPNTYNCHRLFASIEEADAYLGDSSQWRPLGVSAEEWEESGLEDYLEDHLERRNFWRGFDYEV